jgi:hypothetical protein
MTKDRENETKVSQELPGSQFDRLSNRLAKCSDGHPLAEQSSLMPVMPQGDPREKSSSKSAGQMLMGAHVLAPNLSEDEFQDALRRNQLFSSADQTSHYGFSAIRALTLLCILAAGTAIALTAFMDPASAPENTQNSPSIQPQRAERAPLATNDRAKRVAANTSFQPVVSLSPIVGQFSEPDSEIIQLAQNESGGLSIQNVAGDSGARIPLKISIDQIDTQDYAFVMVRGLPDGFALSSGFRVKQSWAVSLKDLAGLNLQSPDGYKGRLELEVLLVKGRNSPVESRTMTVSIGESSPSGSTTTGTAAEPLDQIPSVVPPVIVSADHENAAQQDRSSGQEDTKPAEPAPRKLLIDPKEEEAMLKRGLALLTNGDVASARLLLEHIARKGSGKGALALGQTYDPIFFSSINTLGGIQPDRDKAREWYSVAADLGLDAAKDRLSALSSQ